MSRARPHRVELVAIDLDGTLLDRSKRISLANQEAVRELRARGVHVAIVSGRRFAGLAPLIEPLPEDVMVASNSGAVVKKARHGEVLRRRHLRLDVAREVIRFSHDFGIEPIVHDDEGHIVLRRDARDRPSMARYLNETRPPPSWVERLELMRPPVQIGFAGRVADIRRFEAALDNDVKSRPLFRFALARTEYPVDDLALLDVLDEQATKGRTLRFLASYLEIPLVAALAIGDNWNDLDMLEEAGLGIVMGNAPPALRARGFPLTDSNDENGVARAIARYVLKDKKKGG